MYVLGDSRSTIMLERWITSRYHLHILIYVIIYDHLIVWLVYAHRFYQNVINVHISMSKNSDARSIQPHKHFETIMVLISVILLAQETPIT